MMARSQEPRLRWSPEEDKKLIEIRRKYPRRPWPGTAELAELDRSDKSCRERWHSHLKPGVNKSSFSVVEDCVIIFLQSLLGNRWAFIAKNHLPGRTDNDVKNRWYNHLERRATSTHDNIPDALRFHLNQNLPTASSIPTPISALQEIANPTFSLVDDLLIIFLQSRLGNGWAIIANHLPGRTGNDIKNHWYNHLERLGRSTHQNIPDTQRFHLNQNLPNASSIPTPISALQEIANPTFSLVDDLLIIFLQSRLGNGWAIIANHLPGRTGNDIKNQWYNHLERLGRSAHQNILDTQRFHLNQNLPNASSIPTPISASQEITNPCFASQAYLEFPRADDTIHHSFGGDELGFDFNPTETNFVRLVSFTPENEFMPTEEVTNFW